MSFLFLGLTQEPYEHLKPCLAMAMAMSSKELELIFTLEHVSGGIMERRLMELVILCISLISQEGKITKTWLGSGAKMKRKKVSEGSHSNL